MKFNIGVEIPVLYFLRFSMIPVKKKLGLFVGKKCLEAESAFSVANSQGWKLSHYVCSELLPRPPSSLLVAQLSHKSTQIGSKVNAFLVEEGLWGRQHPRSYHKLAMNLGQVM